MKAYYYVKDTSSKVSTKNNKRKIFKILSLLSFLLGSIFLSLVVFPIASYQFKQSWVLPKQELAVPIPEAMLLEAKGLLSPVQTEVQAADNVLGKETKIIEEKDLTLASNWFQEPYENKKSAKITHYRISIPKLNIQDAVVGIGGDDLKKNLIQYPGTALPGQLGNSVILGHSVLPVFYDPEDYNTIFSKLPTLESEDEILIDFDGIKYTYVVHDYYEVNPEDVQLMEQKFDRYELSLLTCVPPGTYLRRGVIRAYLARE